MKKAFATLMVLLSLVSTSGWGETWDDLVFRDGLYYKKFSDTPFSGYIKGLNKKFSRLEIQEGIMKNGKRDGDWKYYYDSGQLQHKETYVNGMREGRTHWYSESGKYVGYDTFVNGKHVGPSIEYFENGEVKAKRPKGLGSIVMYYDNGTIRKTGRYHKKWGCQQGEWIEQYRNGKIKSKGHYQCTPFGSIEVGAWLIYKKAGYDLDKNLSGFYSAGKKVSD